MDDVLELEEYLIMMDHKLLKNFTIKMLDKFMVQVDILPLFLLFLFIYSYLIKLIAEKFKMNEMFLKTYFLIAILLYYGLYELHCRQFSLHLHI